MKILVTGAAGFIGYHVTHALLQQGLRVWGIDNLNAYYNPRLKQARVRLLEQTPHSEHFDFLLMDLTDRPAMESLIAKQQFTHIIHLAAQAGVRYSIANPHAYAQSNLVSFLNILEGARAVQAKHLIYASSSSVYGLNAAIPFRESDNVDHPVSLYAATKKANELMAHTYSYLYNIPCTGLRFFTVYGPWGRPDMAYYSFTEAILRDHVIYVNNNGQMRRDFTYIDDVVESILRLLDKPPQPDPEWNPERPNPATSIAPFRIYNIGNHTPIELNDFIATLERLLGKKAKIEYRGMAQGDVLATAADVTALHAAVGFQPSTPLEEGLKRFIAWYREYGYRFAAV
ncbi:MAG: NAD-dependent epimerase [Methylacidiphilales bacterium]|nr:NAD-dependent epimerase [Candidatus Methylacidiphilales bacterium]MDW8348879.1 NAD-dependent epimerase [Verrucomicrobiae bacterium]